MHKNFFLRCYYNFIFYFFKTLSKLVAVVADEPVERGCAGVTRAAPAGLPICEAEGGRPYAAEAPE